MAKGHTVHIAEFTGLLSGMPRARAGRVILRRQPGSLTGPVTSVEIVDRFSFELP
jgi:hypothetical protein